MLDWNDGQPYSTRFGDVYFSRDSGLEETRHVFLNGNRLTERFLSMPRKSCFAIGETGFGTGLNFLCTCQLFLATAPADCSLDFFSTELFPLDDEELSDALALWPELQEAAQTLLSRWHRRTPGWNRWHFAEGRIRLTLAIGDVRDSLKELPDNAIDAWFLDGFAPSKNPEMWSPEVLKDISRCSRAEASFATYTSAGWVRRGLEAVGFNLERIPGYGRKREMSRGHLTLGKPQPLPRPDNAIVIGGGLAGCAVAWSLARQGISVTLIEQADHLAAGASGNPRGILHARFSAGMNPLHQLVLSAYGHALSQLDDLIPVDGVLRQECGLLQLACNDNEIRRIDRLAEKEWPVHLLQTVDIASASELVGITMEQGGLWFPAGGWVNPSVYCERMADHPLIEVALGVTITTLDPIDTRWQVSGHQNGHPWTRSADIVIVCNSYQASALELLAHLPLTPVRGQISTIPATGSSQHQHGIVCGDGYCAPAHDGSHVCGATHSFNDIEIDLRAVDHQENLQRLSSYAAGLWKEMNMPSVNDLGGRASIRSSAPGAIPLVGMLQPGLFCSLAHGTRGLLTTGIAGELIGSLATHTLQPLPTTVTRQMSPDRWALKS